MNVSAEVEINPLSGLSGNAQKTQHCDGQTREQTSPFLCLSSDSVVRVKKQEKLAPVSNSVCPCSYDFLSRLSSAVSIAFHGGRCIEISSMSAGGRGANPCLRTVHRSVNVSTRHAILLNSSPVLTNTSSPCRMRVFLFLAWFLPCWEVTHQPFPPDFTANVRSFMVCSYGIRHYPVDNWSYRMGSDLQASCVPRALGFTMLFWCSGVDTSTYVQWPLLLTWFNFNPSMDK